MINIFKLHSPAKNVAYMAVINGPQKLVHQTGILVKIGPTSAEFNIFRVNDP